MRRNKLDKQYIDLVQDILERGVVKKDRTGTGTVSLFGKQIKHEMSDGFPLLTTKNMPWKTMVTELVWFLRGGTNIKYLVDNGCNIWVGDAYKNYCKFTSLNTDIYNKWMRNNGDNTISMFTEKEFTEQIKTNSEFAEKWGELGDIYGHQWRDWGGTVSKDHHKMNGEVGVHIKGIDQITNLINDLKNNPDSRRLMVNAWNISDLPNQILPPCHYGFQVYTRELSHEERYRIWFSNNYETGMEYNLKIQPDYDNEYYAKTPSRAISLMWNQRSVDTGLGLPFNIASYGLLLKILALIVNMVPDELIGNLGDTHLYSNHVEPIKEQLDREGFELPKVYINSEFWLTKSGECGVGEFTDDFDSLIQSIEIDDFQLENYQSHPKIVLPLSN